MTKCVDSKRAGIVGCGRTWAALGEAHCVVCHEHFTPNYAADQHWVDGRHIHPGEARTKLGKPRLVLIKRASGPTWTTPMDEGRRQSFTRASA